MPVLMRPIATKHETPSVRVSTGMSSVNDRSETPHSLGCTVSIENL